MAHLEEDIIERAKNTDMIALLESEEGSDCRKTPICKQVGVKFMPIMPLNGNYAQ